jgi:hypothetical protein
MHWHLLIPAFPFAEIGTRRFASAEFLIARGRRKRLPAISQLGWLFERFGISPRGDWPVAPYTLLADGGAPLDHFWMRADPVHLSLTRDSCTLVSGPELGVSSEEVRMLVESLNAHFGAEMPLHPLRPTRWYLQFEGTPEVQTTPPSDCIGPVTDHVPSGPGATRLNALMNEAQMLLHDHPVNTEREARGAPTLNSVWFWGGGAIDRSAGRPFSTVIGDDPLTRGLALAAGIPIHDLPKAGGRHLFSGMENEGAGLVALAPMHSDEELADIEHDWFQPLVAALKSGRIGMLTLHLCGLDSRLEVEAIQSDLRRFWRLRRPLAHYTP